MLTRRQVIARSLLLAAALPARSGPLQAQAPLDQARPISRIAIGSCASQDVPQPIWARVIETRPDLMIFAGDNVYGDTVGGRAVTDDAQVIPVLSAAYAKAATVPEFMALRRAVPHLAIWDDHDYGLNDGGVEFRHKDASQKLFADFWQLPADDARRTRPGLYHADVFGPPGRRVQVILLDTRYFRSALKRSEQPRVPGRGVYISDDDAAKTMLGPQQWAWLETQLRAPADVRVMVSSIQVVAEGNTYERWANFPREQKRLYDLIATTRANGVLFVSGDRHFGSLYREASAGPYPLHEMTASGITHSWKTAAEEDARRLGAIYGELNFGTVEIDWPAANIALALRGADGAVARRHTLALADLVVRG